MSGIDINKVSSLSIVFETEGKSYAVKVDSLNKPLFFTMLSGLLDGIVVVPLSCDFSWEPIAGHIEKS